MIHNMGALLGMEKSRWLSLWGKQVNEGVSLESVSHPGSFLYLHFSTFCLQASKEQPLSQASSLMLSPSARANGSWPEPSETTS